MTPERAREIIQLAKGRQAKLGGCCFAGPWEDHIHHFVTPEDQKGINEYWDLLPGNFSRNAVLQYLAKR